MQAVTGTECPPPCVVCHVLPTGGKNWNAFGLRVVPYSLNQRPWPEIFDELRKADVDSDGDGRLDIVEIEHGTNPSRADDDTIICPRYGCGARIAPAALSPPLPGMSLLAGMALLMLASRRQNAALRRSVTRVPGLALPPQ